MVYAKLCISLNILQSVMLKSIYRLLVLIWDIGIYTCNKITALTNYYNTVLATL